jgi:peptidoglycan-associated lipoprotein
MKETVMNRKWTLAAWLVVGLVMVAGVSCKKKAPATPEAPMDPVAPTATPAEEVIAPPVQPADDTPDWMSDDIKKLNENLRAAGLIGDVYFDFDKYDLKPEARDRLAKNAAFMRENPSFEFSIEGHCDERGTNEYNLALGDRRANAAADYTTSLGIPINRLRTVSFGEERPVCNERSPSCWDRNRRAHFVVTSK